jgi:hypothetical protein
MHTFQINNLNQFFSKYDVLYMFQTSRIHPQEGNADLHGIVTCIYVGSLFT